MNHYQDKCSVENCLNIIGRKGARGLCSAHLKRVLYLKNKDLSKPIQKRGEGWTSTHGYKYIGKIAQHRKLVEQSIGRTLEYNEVIHHKDGNKLNNDLSNLEIIQRSEHISIHCKGKTNEQRKIEIAKYGICLPNGLGDKP
jgi:hypothetical protein